MPDLSPWAFTPSLGFAAKMVTVNMVVFWMAVLVLFWISSRSRQPISWTEQGPENRAAFLPSTSREMPSS